MKADIDIPKKMGAFASSQSRHKVARGGRGSGKSWSVARLLAIRGYRYPTRWLCCREVQRSLRESSLRVMADQIAEIGLGPHYEVQRDRIIGRNGTEFTFTGLQDHTSDSIKSYEGYDGAWIEEAQSVSQRSAEVLIPTIRKPGSELWWTYNPDQEDDYVHSVIAHRSDALVVDINWRDNPWFPVELESERRQLKVVNEDTYQHVWEGHCRSLAGLMFKRDWFKHYDALPEHLSLYLSADYAVTQDGGDFTELGMFGLDTTGDLYVVDWWSGQTDPEQWIEAAIRLVKLHKPQMWFEEKGVILRSLDSAIAKRLRERKVWIAREGLASAGNKAARALGFAARASAGAVWLPKDQPWSTRLLNQLCAFNGQDGKTDDMVDVCSLIARGLDSMADAQIPESDKRPDIVPFTKSWLERQDQRNARDAAEKRKYYR